MTIPYREPYREYSRLYRSSGYAGYAATTVNSYLVRLSRLVAIHRQL